MWMSFCAFCENRTMPIQFLEITIQPSRLECQPAHAVRLSPFLVPLFVISCHFFSNSIFYDNDIICFSGPTEFAIRFTFRGIAPRYARRLEKLVCGVQ